jgi:AAA domain
MKRTPNEVASLFSNLYEEKAMRPISIDMEGFTSFRERVYINFSNLDLFAITGPAGAGKTSIIDAMTDASPLWLHTWGWCRAGLGFDQGMNRASVLPFRSVALSV